MSSWRTGAQGEVWEGPYGVGVCHLSGVDVLATGSSPNPELLGCHGAFLLSA